MYEEKEKNDKMIHFPNRT